jgi:cell division transport system ATP-binding protein
MPMFYAISYCEASKSVASVGSMIRCQNVCLEYVAGKPVLDHVNLHLEPGSFTFISGASGAGKSTLLSLLALTQKPTSGSVHLFGEDITELSREELPFLRRKIGTVFQDFELLPHMSVAENVGLPLKISGESANVIQAKVQELLGWIGLHDHADAKPSMLSGGQKQRVAIARAVISKPLLILADEPTGNLDHALALRLMYLFTSLNKIGTTIVFATHDETIMGAFDFPIYQLQDGKMQRQRRPN